MTTDLPVLTTELLAELRRDALPIMRKSGGFISPPWVSVPGDVLNALLDAVEQLVYVESEKDALIGSVLHYKAERDALTEGGTDA